MQTKHLFVSLFLLGNVFLHANSVPVVLPKTPDQSSTSYFRCGVAAPSNFQVTEVGANFISFKWDLETDAYGGYRIQLFRSSDNQLIGTKYRSQDQLFVTFDQLVSNEGYYATINSRCGDGEDSENKSSSGPVFTLILDLIVYGYTPPTSSSDGCSIPSSSYCNFSNNDGVHGYKVSVGGYSRCFGISTFNTAQGVTHTVDIGYHNNPLRSPISFHCMSSTGAQGDAPCAFAHIMVKLNGNLVALIEITNLNGLSTSKLQCSYLSNCTVTEIVATGKPNDDDTEVTDAIKVSYDRFSAELVKVSPNPFLDNLDLTMTQKTGSELHVTLIAPDGKMLRREHFDTDQSFYSLPTEDLRPGLYFLKIESGDQIQTLKVLKSE